MKSAWGRKAPLPSEHDEQCVVVDYVHRQYPNLLIAAIPNAAKRSVRLAAMLKKEGMVPGFPDLIIAHARGDKHGLFIEMKRAKGGRTSPSQLLMIKKLKSEGYVVAVCAGAAAAIETIDAYMRLKQHG